jgi:hypothetical protein
LETPPIISKKSRREAGIDKKKIESPEPPNKRVKKATLKVVEKSLKKQQDTEKVVNPVTQTLVEEIKG